MTTAMPPQGSPTAGEQPYLQLQSRPVQLYAAAYTSMPLPNLGPVQEVVFDLGITAHHAAIEISGLVFKGYAGHQLLFEQRWPARFIRQRTREQDLNIPAGTGLAIGALHFMLHAYEALGMVEVTAVGKAATGEAVQTILQMQVIHYIQKTNLHFPLEGAWWAIQGADWSDQHKLEPYSQPYALDLAKLGADNQIFHGTGHSLEDHYSWNQPVYAAAGGKVAYVCFDMPDIAPGVLPDPRIFRNDPRRTLGNAVAISHANGEFSYYAHLQQASIQVNEGEMVRRGTLIGRVGSSGRSPGPHLHFHLMTGPNLFIDQGLPAQFTNFWAAGQFFDKPVTIPTRLIVIGPVRSANDTENP
jgi:hypothetical protein